MRTHVVALALLMPTLAHAVVWRHDADPGAALALGASIPAVGRVLPDGSATLIAPTWAITAAHVARGVTSGSQLEFGGVAYPVVRVVVHPEGLADPARPRQPPEVDLALLELARPVVGITPLPLYRDRAELGTTMTIVGCGDFGAAGAARTPQDGRCRAVTNVVADAGPTRLFFPFDPPPAGTTLEGIGVAGDSGGPALIDGNGTWQVAGVSSGGDGPPGAYGSTDIYTRVSSYLDWIEATRTTRR